jgi:hypothetical protein
VSHSFTFRHFDRKVSWRWGHQGCNQNSHGIFRREREDRRFRAQVGSLPEAMHKHRIGLCGRTSRPIKIAWTVSSDADADQVGDLTQVISRAAAAGSLDLVGKSLPGDSLTVETT